MRYSTTLIGAAVIAAMPVFAQAASIHVTGTGTVAVEPDMAVITLGVSEEHREAGQAMERVSTKVASVLDALELAGIAARDVQTQSISVNPVWNNSATDRKISGFEASNTVAVRVRVLDSLGYVIDRVLDSGANVMHGLSFQLTDDTEVMEEARRAAVKDAMAKAQIYADAAGVPLGAVTAIDETGSSRDIGRMDMAMSSLRKEAPVAQGELVITSTVSMTFDIGADAGK